MARNATGWNPPTGWLLFGGIASAAAVIDLVTKSLLFARLGMPGLRPGIVLVPRMLSLETNLNEGVSVAAIAGITAVMSRRATRDDPWLVVALALVTGGIIGNLYDRLGLPGLQWHAPLERVGKPVLAVRDWIHFELPGIIDWPIFNLADTWLVIGAALLMLVSLRTPPENQSAS
jgi:signal peptidase II